MELPFNYLEVEVKNKRDKKVGIGFLYLPNTIHCLYVLMENDGVITYTRNEVLELFRLYNPVDGFEYDLNKLFN